MPSYPTGISWREALSISLLLDLDNTLLKNDISTFLPNYLKAFSEFAADFIPPDLFVRSLMAGTEAMINNRKPDCTLKEVFKSVFFPLTSTDPQSFQEVADQFYREVFPTLRRYTEPIPAAQDLVRQAIDRSYQLNISTNPLFPIEAIHHRLDWAGLSASEYPFRLVSSYESFHYSKPDPAYFAEILGRLGWPGEPVILVGNDPEQDIKPAQANGIVTYWKNSDIAASREEMKPAQGSGLLEDFLPWLDCIPADALLPNYSVSTAWLPTLRATPAVIDSIMRSLPFELWTIRPDQSDWCFTEILCHLRDVDNEVNFPRLVSVIETPNPFISGQDTDPWAEQRNYRQQDGRQAFHQFVATRMRMLALLESLSSQEWQLPARHAIFGPNSFAGID